MTVERRQAAPIKIGTAGRYVIACELAAAGWCANTALPPVRRGEMPGTTELAGSQSRSGGSSVRLRRARIVLAASAAVFIGFAALGYLSLLQAVIGFALVAAASLVGRIPNPIARPSVTEAERAPPDVS